MATTTNETKRAAMIEVGTDTATASLKLAFANGQIMHLQLSQLSEEIQLQATLHGLKQKLVDAAAISRDPTTGRSATVETKYQAVREVYDRLLAGEWNKRREGGTGGAGGLLFAALVRMYDGKKTAEEIREFLDQKSDAEQAALRKNAKVAAIIEEIRAERAARGTPNAGGVDSDALLGELGS